MKGSNLGVILFFVGLFCNSQRLVQSVLLGLGVRVGVFLPNPKEPAGSGKGLQACLAGRGKTSECCGHGVMAWELSQGW